MKDNILYRTLTRHLLNTLLNLKTNDKDTTSPITFSYPGNNSHPWLEHV